MPDHRSSACLFTFLRYPPIWVRFSGVAICPRGIVEVIVALGRIGRNKPKPEDRQDWPFEPEDRQDWSMLARVLSR